MNLLCSVLNVYEIMSYRNYFSFCGRILRNFGQGCLDFLTMEGTRVFNRLDALQIIDLKVISLLVHVGSRFALV